MAQKKGLGIGDRIMNKIGDILTPTPKVEAPMPAKKTPTPGDVASPESSVGAIRNRQRELDRIK